MSSSDGVQLRKMSGVKEDGRQGHGEGSDAASKNAKVDKFRSADGEEVEEEDDCHNEEDEDEEEDDDDDGEEEEEEPPFTARHIVVVICNLAAVICLVVALAEPFWIRSRNGKGIYGGLFSVCVHDEERHAVEHLFGGQRCGSWSDFGSWTSEATDKLSTTVVRVSIAISASAITFWLHLGARLRRIEKALMWAGFSAFLCGSVGLSALSSFSEFRGQISSRAENNTSQAVSNLLKFVAYDYCLGLSIIAVVCAMVTTGVILD